MRRRGRFPVRRGVNFVNFARADSRPRPLVGMALRLVAGLLLAVMFVGVKWLGQRGMHVVESLFYRQIGTALCALGAAALGGGVASLRTRRVKAHVVRMSLGLAAMGLNFLSFTLLPLAEATAIGFSVPILATMLAALWLKEPTGPWRWGAVVAGFVGVLVVIQPGSGHLGTGGALVAGAAALTTAAVTIAIRQLGATEAAATTAFWFGLSSLIPLGLAMPFFAGAHPPALWPVVGGMALAGGLAQLALTGAFRFAPVALVMPMDYAMLLWSTLAGLWLFGETPASSTWWGAPIIIGSGLVILWREARRATSPPA